MFKKIIGVMCFFLSASTALSADKLTVLLDWFANPSHAPLLVAEEYGFFKQQNLDITLIGPADPADPPKLVAARQADIAITYQPQFMEQVDHGMPLIRIGTLIDKPLNCLAVLNESGIQRIADLKGKRVGQSVSGINQLTLKTMLKHHDLTLSEIELINVHYNLSQALLTKRIDAVTGLMRTYEVIQMDLAHHPVHIFLPEKNGLPTYSELIFVTHQKEKNDPRISRFLLATQQGYAYLHKHPEECWQRFAKAHPEAANELNHRAWFATLPYFAKNPVSFNQQQWEAFANFMLANHLIKEVKPISTYTVKRTI